MWHTKTGPKNADSAESDPQKMVPSEFLLTQEKYIVIPSANHTHATHTHNRKISPIRKSYTHEHTDRDHTHTFNSILMLVQ